MPYLFTGREALCSVLRVQFPVTHVLFSPAAEAAAGPQTLFGRPDL